MPEELRICRKCHLELPVSSFSFTNAAHTRRKARCKTCEAERVRGYYANNPVYRARQLENTKRHQKPRSADQSRRYLLKGKYSLTIEQYDGLLALQSGHCALCTSSTPGRFGKNGKWSAGHWHVDHCHTTGRVRGLLCHPCNTQLGGYEALIAKAGEARLLEYMTRESPVPAAAVIFDPRETARVAEPPPRYTRAVCSVDGCGQRVKASGLCGMHYARHRRGTEIGEAGRRRRGKLTAEQVREIRSSSEKNNVIAARLGVSQPMVSMIRAGKVWIEAQC